jgi:small subunit ribosomal protein S3
MGQKTHPSGFRLNTTNPHLASWYQKNWGDYSKNLERDDKIRTFIEEQLSSTCISDIQTQQSYYPKILHINIYVENPIVPLKVLDSDLFDHALRRIVHRPVFKLPYAINLFTINEADSEASSIADAIRKNIEERGPYKRVMRQSLDRVRAYESVLGIKVQLSGRLNGAEIARDEWVKEGRMPLQTLRAKIFYTTSIAKTTYGVIGIKIWIFKGEQFK